MASQTSPKTIPSARKATGTFVCGPEARIFVEVLQKGEIISATLYLQTIQNLCHAVPEKRPRHRKSSCSRTGHGLTFFFCAWRGLIRNLRNFFPIHPTVRTWRPRTRVFSVCSNLSNGKPATCDF
jgi:hypothetical protein